jgi:hypothetical protein
MKRDRPNLKQIGYDADLLVDCIVGEQYEHVDATIRGWGTYNIIYIRLSSPQMVCTALVVVHTCRRRSCKKLARDTLDLDHSEQCRSQSHRPALFTIYITKLRIRRQKHQMTNRPVDQDGSSRGIKIKPPVGEP